MMMMMMCDGVYNETAVRCVGVKCHLHGTDEHFHFLFSRCIFPEITSREAGGIPGYPQGRPPKENMWGLLKQDFFYKPDPCQSPNHQYTEG